MFFFFLTMRRVWLIKGRRGGGGGLAGNRDFPGYIPVLSPTVNPINQSIKAMECFSEWYQTSFRGMSKWSLLIYLDIMVLTKTEKLNAITSRYHISQHHLWIWDIIHLLSPRGCKLNRGQNWRSKKNCLTHGIQDIFVINY